MLIFDNATGVGRRSGDKIHKTELLPVFVLITISVSGSATLILDGKREMWNARWIITEQTSLCLFRIFQMLSSIIISCF